MALQIHLLGSPHCTTEGQPLSLSRRKAMALLAYLAVTAQPHGRDTLATLFWPEYDQSGARANLRRDLSYLKQELGDGVLEVNRTDVRLIPEAGWRLDTAAFMDCLEQARVHNDPSAELCSACQAALAEAVELYRGDFMAGFTLPDCPQFDEWQFFQREGLRLSLAWALQRLIDWCVARGSYRQGIDYGRRWVALDPLHEPARRRLMQLYSWDGQQAAALRQYEECTRLLDEELGVAPEAETVALYEAIKVRQLLPPAGHLPAATGHAAPRSASTGSFQVRWRRGELLAVGGHGEVYQGIDQTDGTPVVIKRLRPELINREPEYMARFQREGEMLRRLSHPNIVKMLGSYSEGEHYCIVMEYVSGGSLRTLLDEKNALPVEQVVAIGLELADALSRAHHLGIIHRDLKPENVLLAADGTPRLTDFGVARLQSSDTRLTRTGVILGSPAYMSPEILKGEAPDAQSDIWSLGVLFYEMLVGQRPFKGEQMTAIMLSILNDEVPEISRFQPDIPPALDSLLRHMLSKERSARPAGMRLVAATLEAIHQGRGAGQAVEAEVPLRRMISSSDLRPPEQPAATPRPLRPFTPAQQQLRLVHSADGTHLAYAVVGQGPPLVKAANPLTHLQHDWESPVWRHWVEALSHYHTLVRYDGRGCGLSERQPATFSLEAWVNDLEAVVDDLGLERFPLIGTSQGSAVAIAYAARHPERVSHLICHGGYARGRFHRNLAPEQRAEVEMLLNLIRLGWGKESPAFRQLFAMLFVPEGTPEEHRWFAELARITAEPEVAAAMERAFFDINVVDLASRLRMPTLVTHARGDQIVPLAEGQLLAELIPQARFVLLESNNHFLLEGEPAWPHFLEEIHHFLQTGGRKPIVGARPAYAAAPSSAEAARSFNLPVHPTPFIGRQTELSDVKTLLARPGTRLLTITGPGGVGKTRLALAAAAGATGFNDGVCFVPLAPLKAAGQLAAALVDALGIHLSGSEEPFEQVLAYLASRQLLLVLDNLEHLPEVAAYVSQIVTAAPAIKIMATSRVRLSLTDEIIYPLGGMSYPQQDATVGQEATTYNAVQLLLHHAQRVRPDLEFDSAGLRHAGRICQLVQGHPLALVLAAGWLELLSLEEVAAEIAQSLDFLESGLQDVPERQRSMRAVFESSWSHLTPDEQQTFTMLSVFRGGFTYQAAQVVAGATPYLLRGLVNKSFISAGPGGRYDIHELLRQYGEEYLAAGSNGNVYARHSAYYLGKLKEMEADLKGRRQIEALREIEVDFENIRAAWEWGLQQKDETVIDGALESLHLFTDMRHRQQEGAALFLLARAQLAPPPGQAGSSTWGRILTRGAFLRLILAASHWEGVEADLEEALVIARRHENKAEIGLASEALGVFGLLTGADAATAMERLEQSCATFQALGDDFYLSRVLGWQAQGHFGISGAEKSQELFTEQLVVARRAGSQIDVAMTLTNLSEVALSWGNYEAAERYLQEVTAMAADIGARGILAYTKLLRAFAAFLLRGDSEEAVVWLQEGWKLAADINYQVVLATAQGISSVISSAGSGKYAEARQQAEASLTITNNNGLGVVTAHWGLCLAHCGLGNNEAARQTLQRVVEQARDLKSEAVLTWILPTAALLLARQGQGERAVECLALADVHPLSPSGWWTRWGVLAEMRADLEQALGADTFEAAWERGKKLEPEEALSGLAG